ERRLACAVDAEHAPALLPTDHEVETIVNPQAAVALVYFLQARDVLTGARRRQEVERHRLAPPRRLDPLDLLQFLDPALHLGRVRGARLEALDELDLLGEHGLLALELRLLLLLVERALLLVKFVIAGIGGERAAIDLDDLGDDAVDEFAVVEID